MVSAELWYQTNMELTDFWTSMLLFWSMQQVSLHAHRYPASRVALQKDCNFAMPPTGSNSYTILSWMSASSGSFSSHLCDSMTKRKYVDTTSWMRFICRSSRTIVDERSSLHSALVLKEFICASRSHKRPVWALNTRGGPFSM